MGVDLKKEIHLSDLFRRKAKEAEAAGGHGDRREPPKRRSLGRRREEPKGVAPEARTAASLPAVPLMRAFNLLPREPEREKAARFGLAHVAVALAGLLAFAAVAGFYLFSSAAVSERRGEYDDLRVQLAELEASKQESGASTAALSGEHAARTAAVASALAGRFAWDRLLREFSLVLPEEVSLVTLRAQAPVPAGTAAAVPATAAGTTAAANFTIDGYTREHEDVALILSRLSVVPELSSVSLVSASEVEVEGARGKVVQFQIAATIRQPGGGA